MLLCQYLQDRIAGRRMLGGRDNVGVQLDVQADQGARQGQHEGGVGDEAQEVLPLLPGAGAVDGEQAHHLDGDLGRARAQVD